MTSGRPLSHLRRQVFPPAAKQRALNSIQGSLGGRLLTRAETRSGWFGMIYVNVRTLRRLQYLLRSHCVSSHTNWLVNSTEKGNLWKRRQRVFTEYREMGRKEKTKQRRAIGIWGRRNQCVKDAASLAISSFLSEHWRTHTSRCTAMTDPRHHWSDFNREF